MRLKENLEIKMKFEPLNRHLLLKPVSKKKEEKKQSTILVPEDYVAKKRYDTYKLVSIAPDCTNLSSADAGKIVVVDNAMVEQVDINGDVLYLLLENYIYGALKSEK
jgi:co-chaperonin GroES (HSP10)